MLSRRSFLLSLVPTLLIPLELYAQAGILLSEEEAPQAVFPLANTFERIVVPSSATLRKQVQALLGKTRPSLWEREYTIFKAKDNQELLGYAVVVEEIGKHRPITFVVGITPDNKVQDVAVMVYREPYGGAVRYRRFLKQYAGKGLSAPLLPYRDIRNITGATLSCYSMGRGVRKALALVRVLFLQGQNE
ncbi:MAG: FMN-binding protein [Candidatus Methylomirabilales bacterium]